MTLAKTPAALMIGLSLFTAHARGDAFDLNVNGTSNNANVSSSSLPNLLDDLVNTKGQFQQFDGQAYNASLKYGGVSNAILLDSNSAGTDVTLRIPSTGLTKHFTGASAADVQNQIQDFLLKDGSAEYAKFLQKINEQSLLGVVDGNPRATTALMSDHAFSLFGISRDVRTDSTSTGESASGFRVDASAGTANNDEANENFYNLAIQTGFVGDHVGLTFSTIANYRDVEGSKLGSVGFELGLPIVILPPKGDSGLIWTLTPTGSVSGGASYDLAAGGTMWGVGLTSSLSLRINRIVLTMGNQITYYKGFSVDIGSYQFDTLVDQEVLKNGLGVAFIITPMVYVNGSVTYTNFLQEAAIDQYVTPSLGLGLKFGTDSGFRVAYTGDFGDHYTANGIEAALYFGF